MAISVQQLHEESIICFTFEGEVDKQSVVNAYADSLDLSMNMSGPVYRVFDLSQTANNYADVITMIANVARDVVGAAVHPELAAVFVGTVPTKQVAATDIAPYFEDQDEALAFVRQQIGEHILI